MKNKIISLFIVMFIVVFLTINSVSASFADFTDEQADKQAQEQIKEQEKQHSNTEVKSSDNYLSSLQVEGYTINPEFDKQTLEYTIKEEVKGKEINIKATTSNDKATVNGIGNIKVEENKNQYRIDVTAENGSVRTYIVNLKSAKAEETTSEPIETEKTEENIESIENVVVEQTNKNEDSNENSQSSNIYIVIAIGIIIILCLLFLLTSKKKKHKGKH